MNKITIKVLSILILSFAYQSTIQAVEVENSWYLGVTVGSSSDFLSDVEELNELNKKYGLVGGYQILPWLTIESELANHEATKKRFSGNGANSDLYVDFQQDYDYGFVGIRVTKFLGSMFGFTGRIGATYARYESNFESESEVNFSPSVGMLWRIKDFTITNEIQQITYPVANGRSHTYESLNVSIMYSF